jgi:hypothetical protein
MPSSSHKLMLMLVAKVKPITRATSITMEIPIAMATLKGLYPSQATQSGELEPCHDIHTWQPGDQDPDVLLGPPIFPLLAPIGR